MKKFLVIVCVVFLALTGCTSNSGKPFISKDSLSSNRSFVTDLKKQNVQVVQLGQKYRVILPTDTLFKSNTAQLKQKYIIKVMVPLANLIQNYGKHVQVYITGYTDSVGSTSSQLALAKQYANAVAAYLWAQGIPLHNMHIKSLGNDDRVASNQPQTSHYNRRVEVQFWG